MSELSRNSNQWWVLVVAGILALSTLVPGSAETTTPVHLAIAPFLETYCLDCHSAGAEEGGLAIDGLLKSTVDENVAPWEKIVHKLATRQMPPLSEARPSESEFSEVVSRLVTTLDRHALDHPHPGHSETFRRLNQTEYKHAIRDLLALDVDVSRLLPKDESSHGFDNVTVTGLSPVLMDRYILAAQKISRLAVGHRAEPAAERTYRVAPDVTQDTHLPGTPIGTRGGMVVEHHFPQDGEYEIQAWLMRDRNEEVEGLRGKYQLEVSLDRHRAELFSVTRPPRGSSDKVVDANLTTRLAVSAGPHEVSVAFIKESSSLLETVRQPLNVHYNYYRHPRIEPAVYQVTIRGPFAGESPENTPSREKLFICTPLDASEETACAERILATLMRRAYRREVQPTDLTAPMRFFHEGNQASGFEAGIERALGAVLVSPHFLFRIERDHETTEAPTSRTVHALSAYELASRLSFFLWSSIPDDELLDLARDGTLQQPEVWEAQVQRLLDDARSSSLIENFAAQWLYLRNLESVKPDMRLYPDFDDNLRQAMRQETELFLEEIVRRHRSVLDMLRADFTYLNERLAKHYDIPHVYGSRFRRVELPPDSLRGGLLRHGSILSVTSYATRTSPVIRGNWVLKNILGSPPPPPPPNVPTLNENTVAASLPLRQRLEQHRNDPTCASCHSLIDPIGFALENFDPLGRWRDADQGEPISARGTLADGQAFDGVAELEQALLRRPEWFVRTLTEKLMTFALGRGLEPYDAAAVRRIVRDAEKNEYRFSAIVLGITKSVPFQMRTSP